MESDIKSREPITSFDGVVEEEDPRYFNLFTNRLVYVKVFILLMPLSILISEFSNIYGRDSKILSEIDEEESIVWKEERPQRGTIYSDDRQVLAIDILSYSLRFDPLAPGIDNPKYENGQLFQNNYKELAAALSNVLKDKTPQQYEKLLISLYNERKKDKGSIKRNILMINRQISPSELSYLKMHSKLIGKYDANKSGIKVESHYERKYPNGNIAKRTIGLQTKNGAVTGLEESLDNSLSGRIGVSKTVRVTSKTWIQQSDDFNFDVQDGYDVITTLNVDLQKFVQKAMASRIRENNADWGTAIVMDVATGDVKAVANVIYNHEMDSVFVEQSDSAFYAIHQRIEPGSTFKTVVFLALLERKHIPLTEIFETGNGPRRFSRAHLTVTDDHSVGTATFQEVLEQSSNIGMSMAVERHCSSSKAEMQALDDIIAGFGILNKLDLDIETSIKPVMRTPKDKLWSYSDFITQSFGYAVNMTPMHIAMFYNAIANNGVMVNPRFVSSLEESKNHTTIKTKDVIVLNPKICSDENLLKVRQSLEGVVLRGTGRRALDGCKFRCAGKTGTAKVSRGRKGYVQGNVLQTYYGTFVGYFPADKPRYTVYVGFQTRSAKGSGKPWSGAGLSAPVFKEIADYIYEKENNKIVKNSVYVVSKQSKINASIGDYSDLKNVGEKLKINVSVPVANSNEMVGLDSTGIVSRIPKVDSSGMLNLKGYSLIDALNVAHSYDMKVSVVGEGRVYRQETAVKNGKKEITLYLK